MAIAPPNRVSEHIQQLLEVQCNRGLTDGALLDRFAAEADQAAFAQLVRRHGPLVLNVCRRVLANRADADDAFQAAFLMLARKAASIRQRDSIASWLFAVARRLALHARAGIQRRSGHESQARDMVQSRASHPSESPEDDLRSILDEELSRLPEKYRAPLVLCYLEGRSRSEAARQLGWKTGAVKIRLERGRNLLRSRLMRRGLSLTPGAIVALVGQAASAPLSAALIQSTTQAATAYAAGAGLFTGLVSERALAFVEGMRKTMLLSKLKIVTVILLAAGLLGTSAAALVHPFTAPEVALAAGARADENSAEAEVPGDALPAGARARLGTTRFLHESDVVFTAYAVDGKYLITGTQAGAVRVWDAVAGKEIRLLVNAVTPAGIGGNGRVPPAFPTALAVSTDGKTLATAPSPGNVVTLWEVDSGKQIGQCKSASPVALLIFAPNGKSLFSKCADTYVRHSDLEGKELRKYGEQPKNPWMGGGNRSGLAVSPDGKTVASTIIDPQGLFLVKRWDVATGKNLQAKNKGERGEMAIFAADGKTFAWANRFKSALSVREIESDKEIRTRTQRSARASPAFLPSRDRWVGLPSGSDRPSEQHDAEHGAGHGVDERQR